MTWKRPHLRPRTKWIIAAVIAIVFGPPSYLYYNYAKMVDARLSRGAFANTSDIYAAPVSIGPGDQIGPDEIVRDLRNAGYTEAPDNRVGYYVLQGNSLEIHPGPDSYFAADPARIRFKNGQITELAGLQTNQKLADYKLEPQLITNLVGGSNGREKRRLVNYNEIPPVLVHAVVSAEDKHFFQHIGFDPLRVVKAAFVDVKSHRKEQGASTLSMQLARNFWLDSDKNWKRKTQELMITLLLEERLTKQQIFQAYGNEVYLGQQDTYSIHGFGEAARVYFNKDIGQLTLPEAALLAGMIQRPSYFNPFRYPDRAMQRRNQVLKMMAENKYITQAEYASASTTPIQVHHAPLDSGDAPYFMALMTDELGDVLPAKQAPGLTRKIYTTLDPELQRDAAEAIRVGMPLVDKQIKNKKKDHTLPQVALIAIDPHTGEVKAAIGGRDYSTSQLNHILSERQPGSVFKPFVYAAAISTATQGGSQVFTPVSTLMDAPTTFQFDNQTYQPSNFEHEFMGRVTLQKALAHSLNVATVSLAQQIGFDKVVALAKQCGIADNVQPTPAVALGAYEATPLEIAGAYTVFANRGIHVQPHFVDAVKSTDGNVAYSAQPQQRQALDPRVSYVMLTMLEEVMRSGTAAGVRSRGLTVDAAGKTGTSRDGWFAGFTSDLLCIVWVGFDDNRELNIEGARSALPIWTEFMKRAVRHREYAKPFPPAPSGVVTVKVDLNSGLRAGPYCSGSITTAAFIAGTEPKDTCSQPIAQVDEFGQPITPGTAPDQNSFTSPASFQQYNGEQSRSRQAPSSPPSQPNLGEVPVRPRPQSPASFQPYTRNPQSTAPPVNPQVPDNSEER